MLVLALLTGACSSNDPEIMQVDLRIRAVLHRDSDTVREELVVFVQIQDPDGPEDMGWVVVEFPQHGVGWELSENDLVQLERTGEYWFGAAGLIVPGMTRIPRGALVRITASDLGGRTAEREIRIPLSTIVPESGDFPRPGEGGVLVQAGTSTSGAAAGGMRHFLKRPDGVYRIGQEGGVLPAAEGPFFLLAEGSAYLWLESGPWSSSDF